MPNAATIDKISGTVLSGWFIAETEIEMLQFAIDDGNDVEVDYLILPKTSRPDLPDNHCAIRMDLKDPSIALKIAAGELGLNLVMGSLSLRFKVWPPIKIASLISLASNRELDLTLSLLSSKTNTFLSQHYGSSKNTSNNSSPINANVFISDDEASIVEFTPEFFLYKGSNDVHSLYANERLDTVVSDSWSSIVASRADSVERLGAKFLQVYIPEKSTALRHLTPYDVKGPTALWRSVIERSAEKYVVNALDLIEGETNRESWYRKNDSHFSSYGCLRLTQEILKRFDLIANSSTVIGFDVRSELLPGDLGRRFIDRSWFSPENVFLFQQIIWNGKELLDPDLHSSYDPDTGVTGMRRIFRNATAPIDEVLVCFGNSFFERGFRSIAMSWWFARIFREFHFLWQPNIDTTYLELVQPKYVIAQSVERFLGRSPKH